MANTALTLQSSNEELKAYFEAVCRIADTNSDEFPINLDEVWPLLYSEKSKAVRALTSNDQFIENVDYKVLAQIGENPLGGRPANEYHLTTSCFEFFIARKVRPVFEVYRQVFHAARKGELAPKPLTKSQQTLEAVKQLCKIAQQQVELEQRHIMHKGNSYEVRGRIVLGVDEVASEYASWDRDSDRKEQLTLILKLVRVG